VGRSNGGQVRQDWGLRKGVEDKKNSKCAQRLFSGEFGGGEERGEVN